MLLIVPEGIEMQIGSPQRMFHPLLIVPEGIEIFPTILRKLLLPSF